MNGAKRSAEAVGCKNESVGERSALEERTRTSSGGRSGSENRKLFFYSTFIFHHWNGILSHPPPIPTPIRCCYNCARTPYGSGASKIAIIPSKLRCSALSWPLREASIHCSAVP
ncbi:hypothetical protein HN51_065272 [Arachis hypogaea]|nr:uncharacterized protein DS421_14g454460 [Arachis hypogaea]